MTEEHQACLICQGTRLGSLAGYEGHQLVRCRDCGFVFIWKIPTPAELAAYYRHYGMQTALSPITVGRYHELLDRFESHRQTNRILDVGCGVGYFLGIAQQRGWDVYGNEVAAEALEKCVAKGIHMQTGALRDEHYAPGGFDVITMFETIEHINNPIEEVERIRRFLRPGGLVYCTTPNFNSLLRRRLKAQYNVINYPEHLSYYTPRTLDRLFVTHGYDRVGTRTTGLSLTRYQDSRAAGEAAPSTKLGEVSSDEQLRQRIEASRLLQWGKRFANTLLSATGLGMTIKGFYVKK